MSLASPVDRGHANCDQCHLARLSAEAEALRIDLAAARRINDNQRADLERLQNENRRLRERRGGWGDR